MSTFLQRIVARKRVELAERRAAVPEAALESLAAEAPPPRDVVAALEPDRLGVIAEVKRASPSKGAIALDLDAVTQAHRYAEGGADAISVLTDEEFYHGSLDDLRAIRAAVPTPMLRKDFILDRYGLLEAREVTAASYVRRPRFVGVFVNEDPDVIGRLAGELQLDLVQLSGDEAPEECARLRVPYFKVVHVRSGLWPKGPLPDRAQ